MSRGSMRLTLLALAGALALSSAPAMAQRHRDHGWRGHDRHWDRGPPPRHYRGHRDNTGAVVGGALLGLGILGGALALQQQQVAPPPAYYAPPPAYAPPPPPPGYYGYGY